MTSSPHLRHFVSALLERLELRRGFDAEEFVDRLRGRLDYRIKLFPMVMPEGCFGFWSLIDGCNVILFRSNTSWLHQQQIIFHECGHMILRHRPPGFDKFLRRSALHGFGDEQEAEAFATIVLDHAISSTSLLTDALNRPASNADTGTVVSLADFEEKSAADMKQFLADLVRG